MIRRVAAAAILVVAVTLIYRDAVGSYFLDDDFHWLQGSALFDPANLVRLERYDHFYRPIVEIYFYLGRQSFGCNALPFHIASLAIHLINTLVLFLFARSLTSSVSFAALAAMFFAVQPGYVEAVAWIGAITDLLPALWYLLTLWMHLLFLRRGGTALYLGTLATFAACLLTHESAATLLPMMMALEATLMRERRVPADGASLMRAARRYAPFAALLAGFLAVAYVVNSRSYLVREGYYAFGWHAIQHVFDYIIWLYVGKRNIGSYVAIAAVLAILLLRGTPRVRFFVVWIIVSLLPVSFFTWGGASRYLYVPAAGFALLLAEATLALEARAAHHMSPRAARAVAIVLALAVAGRFAVFAAKGAADFRERTRPYERLASALRISNPSPRPGTTVQVASADVFGIPELYIDPAAQVIYCTPDIHVAVR